MAGRVLFGFVADLVPLARTLRLCLIAGALGAALFWLEPTPAVSLVGLMLIGFAFAPVFASLISLTPGRVGLEHANAAIGFQIAAAGLGGAASTGFVGVLAGTFGLEVIGAALLGGALALLALYEAFMRAELVPARPPRSK
jgi:fucose permease